jgi:hypothetical protein
VLLSNTNALQLSHPTTPRRHARATRPEQRQDNLTIQDMFDARIANGVCHTGATMMQALGISLELVNRCQNHVLPGSKVPRHYMLHDYADEKRAAWAALSERLAVLIALRDNV